jgi:hypothetical protein
MAIWEDLSNRTNHSQGYGVYRQGTEYQSLHLATGLPPPSSTEGMLREPLPAALLTWCARWNQDEATRAVIVGSGICYATRSMIHCREQSKGS